MGYRFFAVPAHAIAPPSNPLSAPERLDAEIPNSAEVIERAFDAAEYRNVRARVRLRQLLDGAALPEPTPDASFRPAAVFARPPEDLPALLRLSDQLENLARQETGERAMVWRCEGCGTRYAVPIALVRQVAIRCERCGRPVELSAAKSAGEESLLDPFQGTVNHARRQLAAFFREAMARGWPVLVCRE